MSSVFREHSVIYVGSCFHLPLSTLVNVADAPPVKFACLTHLK